MRALETIDCPNCGSAQSRSWGHEAGFVAVKCVSCGLVYVNPRPGAEEITEANQLGVHRTDDGQLDVTASRNPRRIRAYQAVLRRMLAPEIASGRPMQWLDVGAGYGEFVEAVAGVLPPGSIAEGVEPMRPKVRAAQALDLPIREGLISDVTGQYDGLSLINVFSHIPDFDGFGRELVARLKPGGVLFLETGNGGDLARRSDYPDRLFLPDHLVFAGRDQLRQMLERLGLAVETIEAARVDGPLFAAKATVKAFLAGHPTIHMPYASPFRTLYLKARKI